MGSGYRPLMSGGSRRLWSFCVCVTGETHTLPSSPQHAHSHTRRLVCTFIHSETFFPLFWTKIHELASACGMTSTFVPADSTWPPQRRGPVAAGQLQAASGADEFHHHILSAVVFGKQQMFEESVAHSTATVFTFPALQNVPSCSLKALFAELVAFVVDWDGEGSEHPQAC